MEVEVVSRRENPLLKRSEVRFRVRHPGESTPGRDALRAELAKELKATKDILIIHHARSVFGRSESEGFAKVYKSKDDALRTEREYLLVRNRLKEAVAKEKKEPRAKPPPAKPAAPPVAKPAAPAKEEAKPTEKAAPSPPKKEAAKPEAPKKEAPKKEEKATGKKSGKGA